MAIHDAKPAGNGGTYIPFDQRDGGTSVVFFTRDLSAEGLRKAFAKVADKLDGKVAIKLHTGEQHGPNIIPREWVAELIDKDLPEATIIETNTYSISRRLRSTVGRSARWTLPMTRATWSGPLRAASGLTPWPWALTCLRMIPCSR